MTSDSGRIARAEEVGKRVGNLIAGIQAQYTASPPTSYSRRVLAELRRGVGKDPGECPSSAEFWADPYADPRPNDPDFDKPTPSEWAVHVSLGLYAVHQQSGRLHMYRIGTSFGRACGRLRGVGDSENPGVVRRFQALGTAKDLDELAYHARGLVALLRKAEIGFNYGDFARDLVLFQDPRHRDGVRLRWGRDFYRVSQGDNNTTDESLDSDAAVAS